MKLLLEGSRIDRVPMLSLAKALHHDREALLQLLLALCRKRTLNRIVRCPTYPISVETPDLGKRMLLFSDCIASDPYDVSNALAVLYMHATKEEHRKNTGQYFTPLKVAERAITILAPRHGQNVLDPGCGTGIFPMVILRSLAGKHRDGAFPAYLGIENDPLLALATAVSLDWVGAPANWRILYANYLNVGVDDLEEIGFSGIDTVIANPPFVRFHRLSGKSRLIAELGEANLNLSSLSGLHSYFLAHSSRLLSKGRMAFILPREMNSTRYGSDLLRQLQRNFTLSSEALVYDGIDSSWSVLDLQGLAVGRHQKRVWTLMFFRYDGAKVKARKKPDIKRQVQNDEYEQVRLGLFASIHRGISTGANDFFVVTDESANRMRIPAKLRKTYLKRVIPTKTRKAKLATVFDNKAWDRLRESGKPCWLLHLPKDVDNMPPGLRQYLREGIRKGIHLAPTCKNRKPWFHVRILPIPDLVFTYVSRGYPRFIYNEANAHNLTNLLGIYLKDRIGHFRGTDRMVRLTRLLDNELRNWIDQDSAGRRYAGGLIKFEPGDLENMPISPSALGELRDMGLSSLDLHLAHTK